MSRRREEAQLCWKSLIMISACSGRQIEAHLSTMAGDAWLMFYSEPKESWFNAAATAWKIHIV
jgi:hypothetical protein